MHSILRDIINSKASEFWTSINLLSRQLNFWTSINLSFKLSNSLVASLLKSSDDHLRMAGWLKSQIRLSWPMNILQAVLPPFLVLTDKCYFNGSIEDMNQVAKAVAQTPCPILRKDFINDPIQLFHSAAMGADAVLLIVAILQEKTQAMIEVANNIGLDVLLEVHTREELALALDTSANIIGVNNRNLHTLNVDIQTSLELIKYIPSHIVSVSESGIHDAATARRLFDAGYSALLVGEALVKSAQPDVLIQKMRGACHD